MLRERLENATKQLNKISTSPRLDAELLLAHVLRKPRSYLYARPELLLSLAQQQDFNELLNRRKRGEPIAYIFGRKEFWSLDFRVNRHTLIPRPETEFLVERVLKEFPAGKSQGLKVADLGTGCGAIALAIAKERPAWQVIATDFSADALLVAKENRVRFKLDNVSFFHGDWCMALPSDKFDVIVSNPPYIAEHERHLTNNIEHEPQQALFAEKFGLDAIITIIKQARARLKRGGHLFLEHGFQQGGQVACLLAENGYEIKEQHRMTIAGKLVSCL